MLQNTLSRIVVAAWFCFATAAQANLLDPEGYLPFDPAQAALGQLLFYDKILSGNRNISCGTCHHHDLHGTDRLSLGIGEGGVGLGPNRTPGSGSNAIEARIPRNAPALWNLGHRDVTVLFHDGRVSLRADGSFDTPAGDLLPSGLNSLLAAQALFPMSSFAEMAGHPEENKVAEAFAKRIDLGWAAVTQRLQQTPGYAKGFAQTFDHIKSPRDITITDVANALAAFIGTEWQSNDSSYDAYVRDGTPLSESAEKGRDLFFGRGGCVTCHSGPLFSDQLFHATAMPTFGPGRVEGAQLPQDLGRAAVSGDSNDAYAFRTPSLRNVKLTAPYGHNGAFPKLRDMIRHMSDPVASRAAWQTDMAGLPDVPWLNPVDFLTIADSDETQRQLTANEIIPVTLSVSDVARIEAFLNTLTGKSALTRPLGVPDSVPSGLPVDR